MTEEDLILAHLPDVRFHARCAVRRLKPALRERVFDDLVQTGSMALLRLAHEWEPARASFKHYIYSPLKWAMFDYLKKEVYEAASSTEDMEDADEPRTAIEDEAVPSFHTVAGMAALAGLKPRYAEVLVYKFDRGLTHKQIGVLMHLDQSRIAAIWLRSAEILRAKLSQ